MASIQFSSIAPLQTKQGDSRCCSSFIQGGGVLIAVGGIFIILSAYKILPQGINTISQLGKGGLAIGYSALVLGSSLSIASLIKLYLSSKKEIFEGALKKKESFSEVMGNEREDLGVGETISYGKILSQSLEVIDKLGESTLAPKNLEVEASEKVSNESVMIKGTVYISNYSSGPILHDRYFDFSHRLKTQDGIPIQIKPDDFYVPLKFISSKGILQSLDAVGIPTDYVYLPSCLFKGIKEGDSIRFFYDHQLIDLTCKQSIHPLLTARTSFESFLESVHLKNLSDRKQCLWEIDNSDKPRFMGERIGDSILQLHFDLPTETTAVEIFDFYQQDQCKFGPYHHLEILGIREKDVCFYMHRDFEIPLSEIKCFETRDARGLCDIWIMIPHKSQHNKFPEGCNEITQTDFRGNSKTFSKQLFNPLKGDRVVTYHYGQCCVLTKNARNAKVKLFYNNRGWLQLSTNSTITHT